MRRIGHRGAKGHAPENTVASFEKAIALGCDEIETDVWLTRDDALVITHDAPTSPAGLLTLEQVLDLCRGRIALNVEMKSAGSESHAFATGERVAQLIGERPADDVYVSSFWWSALLGAHASGPRIRRAFIYAAAPDMRHLVEVATRDELWALHPQYPYVTAESNALAHAAGLKVQTWTVNDPEDIAAMQRSGIDGIMSDFPERVPTV